MRNNRLSGASGMARARQERKSTTAFAPTIAPGQSVKEKNEIERKRRFDSRNHVLKPVSSIACKNSGGPKLNS